MTWEKNITWLSIVAIGQLELKWLDYIARYCKDCKRKIGRVKRTCESHPRSLQVKVKYLHCLIINVTSLRCFFTLEDVYVVWLSHKYRVSLTGIAELLSQRIIISHLSKKAVLKYGRCTLFSRQDQRIVSQIIF